MQSKNNHLAMKGIVVEHMSVCRREQIHCTCLTMRMRHLLLTMRIVVLLFPKTLEKSL